MPKTLGMSAAAAESLSPELVLVCPELREQALAELERLVPRWIVVARERAVEPAPLWVADEPLPVGASILPIARFGAAAIVSATAITLSLTLIADAIR
jgi:hypothetical protein